MKLQITNFAWEKIIGFTDLCPNEISGLGKIEIINDNAVVIDVAIFRQEVSAAHSTIEPKSLAEFQSERVKRGESMKDWILWWHSHANMGVFFSGTDTSTIDSSSEFPHLLSLVVNKKHETEARFDVYKPFRLKLEKLPVEILAIPNIKIRKECQKEIDKKVNFPKPDTGFQQSKSEPRYAGYADRKDTEENRGDETYRAMQIPFDDKEKEDMRQEYTEHRKYLVRRVAEAKKLNKEAYTIAQRELSDWDSYGRGLQLA